MRRNRNTALRQQQIFKRNFNRTRLRVKHAANGTDRRRLTIIGKSAQKKRHTFWGIGGAQKFACESKRTEPLEIRAARHAALELEHIDRHAHRSARCKIGRVIDVISLQGENGEIPGRVIAFRHAKAEMTY